MTRDALLRRCAVCDETPLSLMPDATPLLQVTYDELLRRYAGVHSSFDDQIGKDLGRTMPTHARSGSRRT